MAHLEKFVDLVNQSKRPHMSEEEGKSK